MPYRINNLLTTLLIYMTICGCAPDQSFQEMPTTCLSEQNLSEPASPPAYHTERLSEASCMPMPPQPCPSMGYAYVVQPLFAAVPVIIRSDTSVAYGSVQPIQGTVAASQAEVYSNFSTSTPTTTQPIAPPSSHMVEAEHAATPHSRSEEEWLAILMDAVANKAQCSQETVTALIDDVQKHSFSEAQYLRVLALILQLSPSQARIRYNFLQNVAVAATHAMEHHQESLLVQDYLNLAKLFFYSRLRATATTDSLLRTTLALWATHFQCLLHQRPILTPGDSTVLLCFVHKYHITLEETSVAHLSHIIEKDFKLLTLREVRHLFWLYNQTINISPQLVELMYAALTSDLHDWDKTQQDESSVRDLFFILIAGAKLKWGIDKATEGTTTPYTASQQQRFITWLKKMKALPLTQASSGLLSIMHAPEREADTACSEKAGKKSRRSKAAQAERERNDWEILAAAEAQALSELQKAIQFVKHREKESYKVQQLVDKIYLLKTMQKPYDQLVDRAIKAGSVEALFIRAEDLAATGALEVAIPYYHTAHKHRHPEAAYRCAMACQKKAKEEIAKSGTGQVAESWYRKSIAFYRDAIVLYLMDDKIGTRIDESAIEYLYDFFYNTALVATEVAEMRLSTFCLYAILEIRPEVETDRAQRKLTTYKATQLALS